MARKQAGVAPGLQGNKMQSTRQNNPDEGRSTALHRVADSATLRLVYFAEVLADG